MQDFTVKRSVVQRPLARVRLTAKDFNGGGPAHRRTQLVGREASDEGAVTCARL